MTTLSGTEFNDKYPNTEFYKLLHKDSIHFGFGSSSKLPDKFLLLDK